MTLAEFILARYAVAEALARQAVDDDPNWVHRGDGLLIQVGSDGDHEVSSTWLRLPHRFEAADHIAHHDPARVLADLEAKRALVTELSRMERDEMGWDGIERKVLSYLALPYASHPDYRQEWKL